MTYDEALAFWFGRINYELRAPKPGDLKLDQMRTLLRLLGDPHERVRIIHVAGSKGKGSTSAMLASILARAGYRTGLFTSPHLSRVEERIQVDGTPITSAELTGLMAEIRPAVEAMDQRPVGSSFSASDPFRPSHPRLPTFFEIATALGFLHFVRRRVEVAVVEVGIGGRFDATNVCHPLVSVISSISIDHVQQLGDRLSEIAMEKAGIIKPGRPAISGATAAGAREVIEEIARKRGSRLRQLGRDFRYDYERADVRNESDDPLPGGVSTSFRLSARERPWVRVITDRRTWPMMEVGLLGEHQAANAAVAVACVEQLGDEGLWIPDQAVAMGLSELSWPARIEVVGRRPLVVIDCAHNVASAQALVDTLAASFPPALPGDAGNGARCRRLLIFAASADKDVAGMLRVLAPHFAHAFLTRYASSPRSVPPEQLAEVLRRSCDLPFTMCPTAAEAFQAAQKAAGPDDLICVAGSVFLAGELRARLSEASVPAPSRVPD